MSHFRSAWAGAWATEHEILQDANECALQVLAREHLMTSELQEYRTKEVTSLGGCTLTRQRRVNRCNVYDKRAITYTYVIESKREKWKCKIRTVFLDGDLFKHERTNTVVLSFEPRTYEAELLFNKWLKKVCDGRVSKGNK